MPDTADAICASLPSMSADELRKVHARCAVLLALGGSKAPTKPSDAAADPFDVVLYDALCDELRRRTQAKAPPYHIFIRTNAGKRFEQAAELAHAAHLQWYRAVSLAELLSLCRMYAELVLDHLANAALPYVWPMISNSVAELPAIVDAAYPGYAQAGMLDQVRLMRCGAHQPVK